MKDKNIVNIQECKDLIKRYNTITLDEIKACKAPFLPKDPYARSKANKLTGFGFTNSCALCPFTITLDGWGWKHFNCNICIHSINSEDSFGNSYHEFYCFKGPARKTYNRIRVANSPVKLRNAFRARAKYLQSLINLCK